MKTNFLPFINDITASTAGYSLLIKRRNKIVLKKYCGLANTKTNTRITSKTNFRLASNTKPFTAMGIMILKERGLLSFDDTISSFIPDFPSYGENVTIRQLMTHTSGVPDHEKPLYKQLHKKNEPTIYDSLEVLKQEKKTLFIPGSTYTYSNSGYVLLALIIEKISQQKYADFLKKNIFMPLKMTATVVLDETKPIISNRALGYKKIDKSYKLFDYDPLNYIIGDEGIYSNPYDLLKWKEAWFSEKLVCKKLLEESLTPQLLPNGKINACGFSWFISEYKGRKIIYHDGEWVGFTNIMLMYPEKDITVIFLSNTNNFITEDSRLSIALNLLEQKYYE